MCPSKYRNRFRGVQSDSFRFPGFPKSFLLTFLISFLIFVLSSLCEPEGVPQYTILSDISTEIHVHSFGKNFGLKICPDNVFGFSEVAGCPEEMTTFCFYYCSVREIAEAVKVFDFFDFHFLSPFGFLIFCLP